MRKRYLFYGLAIASSFLAAIITFADSAICFLFIKNSWVYGLSIFLVGTLITFLIALFLSIPIKGKSIGSKLDPSFKRIRFPKKEELKYHLLAGVGNAIQTIGYLWVLSRLIDPSAVLPFYQIVILYLLLIESITEKNTPTLAELQCAVVVTFGAIMSSISLGELNGLALLIIFLVVNPGWCLLSIYQRKLKLIRIGGKPNDSINIRFWNLVFSTLFTAGIVFGVNRSFFLEAFRVSYKYFPFLLLLMTAGFFSYVFYIRALGMGKASVTQAIKASSVIFVIPFSLLLTHLIPFSLYETPLLLLIKLMGISLVVLGITSFALTDVKAYIFITTKPGYSIKKLMGKIWSIKGVESVAGIAGTLDLLAKIRTRTLGKGYERVIRKLEEIEGIKEFKWQSILKEWEEI
jgi:DNA-binding Lrp family transcriptional regulator